MEGDHFGNWMTGDLSLGEVQIQYIYMYILLVENLLHGFLSLGVVLCMFYVLIISMLYKTEWSGELRA